MARSVRRPRWSWPASGGRRSPTCLTDVVAMRARLVAPARCLDQADLLRAFDLPVALLQDAEGLERCAAELVEDVAAEGTHYAEIRWAPSLHLERGLTLRVRHRRRGARCRARPPAAAGIDVRLIAVALRTHAPEVAADVARAAVDFMRRWR